MKSTKYIVSATNRPGSNSKKVALLLQKIYKDLGCSTPILSLQDINFEPLLQNPYPEKLPSEVQKTISLLNHSSGFTLVCPEYNGSFPGIFKFFVDHWSYPETFEYRPIAFVGLGGRFGALRAVEQLQQIMGYRNGFLYPQRIFMQNINDLLKEGELNNTEIKSLLIEQAKGFLKFINALEDHKLSAITR